MVMVEGGGVGGGWREGGGGGGGVSGDKRGKTKFWTKCPWGLRHVQGT